MYDDFLCFSAAFKDAFSASSIRAAHIRNIAGLFPVFLGVGFRNKPQLKAAICTPKQSTKQSDFIFFCRPNSGVLCVHLLNRFPSIHVNDWLMGIFNLYPFLLRLEHNMLILKRNRLYYLLSSAMLY